MSSAEATAVMVPDFGATRRPPLPVSSTLTRPTHCPNARAFTPSKRLGRPDAGTTPGAPARLGVYTYADSDIASIQDFIGRLSDLFLD
ncbi:hypothetical protein EMIT0111MI5_80164 [Burkholderia sp. IT-111MI5]